MKIEDATVIDKPNGSRQILAVDDEPIICRVIAKGLAFFRFAHANNGEGSTRNHRESASLPLARSRRPSCCSSWD